MVYFAVAVPYRPAWPSTRISVYLNKDEVDEQVSSLKRSRSGASSLVDEEEGGPKEGLGFKGVSFKWNEVEEKKDDAKDEATKDHANVKAKNGHGNGNSTTPRGSDDTDTTLPISTANITSPAGTNDEEGADRASITGSVEENEHRFELRDLTVIFPEGESTVVTGLTASGKTALLVSLLFLLTSSSVFFSVFCRRWGIPICAVLICVLFVRSWHYWAK